MTHDDHICFLDLPDGRRLCWCAWGPADGAPVFSFHGLPGSRLQVRTEPALLERLGVRLITLDRPGLGRSTFQPGRRVLDWPADVAALADALGLGRFAVMGVSGGGPYAAACAWAMPGRVARLGLVSALAPLAGTGLLRGMSLDNRLLPWLALRAPWLARGVMEAGRVVVHRMGDPLFRMVLARLPESDRRVLRGPRQRRERLDDLREAFWHSARGVVWDARLAAQEWGFPLEEVRIPTTIWHGDADTIVSVEHGRYFAEKIAGSEFQFCPGEGHFLVFERLEEILAEMRVGAEEDGMQNAKHAMQNAK